MYWNQIGLEEGEGGAMVVDLHVKTNNIGNRFPNVLR